MTDLVKKYLDLNKYSNQKADFEDLFLSHPNYPSVFAITDSLTMLSIENVVVKVLKVQLPELPESFLGVYNEKLVLISKTSGFISIESGNGKTEKVNFNEFLSDWSGVVLAIEPNNTNSVNKKIERKWFSYSLPFIALISLSVVFYNYSLSNILLLITSIIGLIISIFIVQEKFGIANEMVSKFCNSNPNASCGSVIKSTKSEINKWIGFSDLPLLFFGINALAILLQPKHSGEIVGSLSLLSLPVIAYSVWVQKFKLKKWCALCLAVSLIVVLQSLVFGFTAASFSSVFFINIFEFVFAFVLITSIWLFIKPVLETKIKNGKRINELIKFKRNYSIFNLLTKKVPVTKGFNELKGLHFGNKNSEAQLTIILSPSCGHCHKAFEDAYELVSKFPERISLNVLFNINPENNDNQYKAVVETLLTIQNAAPEKTTEAIVDWHIRKMHLEEWKEKWTINTIDMKVNRQIHEQYHWCLENEFNYTPVKIINGKLFPNDYEISDLKYFLNDFSEEKQSKEKQSLETNILTEA